MNNITLSIKYFTLFFLLIFLSFFIYYNTGLINTDVDEYTIYNTSDNAVYIEANLNRTYLLLGLNPFTGDTVKSEMLNNNIYGSKLLYKIQLNESVDDRSQFITEENAFLKNFRLLNDRSETVNLKISDNSNYKSVYSTENSLILYHEDKSRITNKSNGNKISVTSDLNKNEVRDIINSSMIMSEKFNNNQTIDFYIVEDNPTRWGGYAYDTRDSVQISWVSDSYGEFSSEDTIMHETIHAHQSFDRSDNMDWIFEGSAEYMATLTYIESNAPNNNQVYTEDFYNNNWYNNYTSNNTISDLKLSDPSTWKQDIEYNRGEHTVYLIDYSLRYHTKCSYNIFDLINWLNDEENINYSKFRSKLLSKTDQEFVNQLDTYVGSTGEIDIYKEKQKISGNENNNLYECQNRQ